MALSVPYWHPRSDTGGPQIHPCGILCPPKSIYFFKILFFCTPTFWLQSREAGSRACSASAPSLGNRAHLLCCLGCSVELFSSEILKAGACPCCPITPSLPASPSPLQPYPLHLPPKKRVSLCFLPFHKNCLGLHSPEPVVCLNKGVKEKCTFREKESVCQTTAQSHKHSILLLKETLKVFILSALSCKPAHYVQTGKVTELVCVKGRM